MDLLKYIVKIKLKFNQLVLLITCPALPLG